LAAAAFQVALLRYSYRIASIGSSFAAAPLDNPEQQPDPHRHSKRHRNTHGRDNVCQPVAFAIASAKLNPNPIPINPPKMEINTASIRNCG